MSGINRIIFATGNQGKMKEIRSILEDTGAEILSMSEAGIRTDIDEDGGSFEENALIKARAVSAACLKAGLNDSGCAVLADDSGLVIDALGGEPGIYSARYLGEDTPYDIKNKELIGRLSGVPDEKRTARFVCAIAAVLADGREFTVQAAVEGRIGRQQKGTGGFGYDPIFYVPEYAKTTAEMTAEEKNRISHRGKALEQMKEVLKKNEGFNRK